MGGRGLPSHSFTSSTSLVDNRVEIDQEASSCSPPASAALLPSTGRDVEADVIAPQDADREIDVSSRLWRQRRRESPDKLHRGRDRQLGEMRSWSTSIRTVNVTLDDDAKVLLIRRLDAATTIWLNRLPWRRGLQRSCRASPCGSTAISISLLLRILDRPLCQTSVWSPAPGTIREAEDLNRRRRATASLSVALPVLVGRSRGPCRKPGPARDEVADAQRAFAE